MRGEILRVGEHRTEQLYTVSTPCLDDHQFKKKNKLESVGKLSKVCSQIIFECLYLARLCRHDILWSVNKLARAAPSGHKFVTDLARLISNIHHTNDYRQYCHVGDTAQHCRCRLCWRRRFKVNIRVNMCLWKSNICSHELDVQEAEVSVSQFHRIGNCFVGCWLANARYRCSRLLECVDRSVTFFLKNTHQAVRDHC